MEYAPIPHSANGAARQEDIANIVALLGSRLCHDLISPLGAIGNGVELLQMSGDWPALQSSPEMSLIEDALQAARARIALFRVAFGSAGGSQRLPQAEFAALVADAAKAGRMRITLDAPGDHGRGAVKLVMLSLMCMETAMPWGASVTISQSGRDWLIRAEAERTRHNPTLWAWLGTPRSGSAQPSASEVHFPLLGLAAAEMSRPIRWSLTEAGAEIAF
ncbi:histidine phosphotransferase [Paracoccus aurantiacus]|uniref:Histidine phosphotransferase n=1 Tax=Paracoccus aurantiacus TaxID=2599412 RepID=A0A5C6S4G8_9RHOB|nr:histidine phosphotransferase family protein [Paracoccus aurantiacus]TXB68721.1 histidine phosphotransferase [Paracoccus aurantiacus]